MSAPQPAGVPVCVLLPLKDSPHRKKRSTRPSTQKKVSAKVFTVRPYRAEDRDLTYQVCLETGDSGKDATELFPNFPDILGDRFVGPYTTLCPDLSFVLEDSEGVCGYVLGALDSQKFYERFRKEWLPSVAEKYATIHLSDSASSADAKATSGKREEGGEGGGGVWAEEELIKEMRNPKLFLPASLQKDYPSHLHIDLMERAQGQGIGGRMIKTILSVLKAKGSHGVHLEMSAHNLRALTFYTKLGFTSLDYEDELTADGFSDEVLILGRKL